MKSIFQLAGVVLLVFLWGQAQYCAGVRGAQIQAARDTLRTERAAFADTVAASSARQAQLRDSLARVVAREADATARLDSTRRAVHAALTSLDSLRARVDEPTLPAEVQELLAGERRLTQAAQGEAAACDAVLQTCAEARRLVAAELEASRALNAVAVPRVRALETRLDQALKASRRKRCGLGGTAGYGVTSTGGQVVAGPSLTVGVSCGVVWLF
jgi:hypothetical protein